MRGLLYEAAAMILNRSRDTSSLRAWALALKERLGFKRAAVALARKLAVIIMWPGLAVDKPGIHKSTRGIRIIGRIKAHIVGAVVSN